jgi:hypothetical protein
MVFDFQDVPAGEAPKDWSVWVKDNKGQVVTDSAGYKGAGSLRFSGVEIASAQRDFPVTAGDVVDLEILNRHSGFGTPSLMIYGLNADNAVASGAAIYKGTFNAFHDDWRQAKVRVLVPQGITGLRVILIVENQRSLSDSVWFDQLKIKKDSSQKPVAPAHGAPAPRVQVDYSNADNPLPLPNRETFNTLRMVTLIHGEDEGKGPLTNITPQSAPAYAKKLRAAGYNLVLTDGQRYIMGDSKEHPTYPDVLAGSLPFPELVQNTKAIASAFHAEGMKVFLHLTAGAAPMEMRERHPERMTVSVKDGQTHTVWGLEWICINNPDFQAEYFKRLEELVRESKANGLMVDETTLMYDTCGCQFCRAAFAADTRLEMPPPGTPWLGDLSNPLYREFLQWRLTVCTKFNDRIRNILRKHDKDGELITYYAMPLNPSAWADHGVGLETAGTVSRPLGFEMISNYSKFWALFISNMKFVRSVAEQNDGDIFSISNPPNYEGIYQNWLMNMSQASHQYWPWFVPESVKEERKPLVQWEAKNRDVLAGLRAAADTAVVISTRNNNLHPEPLGSLNRHNSYLAISNTLTMAQVLYKAIGDRDLDKPLRGKAKTIIALNLSLVSDKQAANLRQFVKDGGTLITSADFSLYDEKANRRQNFALSDIMGCDYVSTLEGDGMLQVEKSIPLLNNVTGRFQSSEATVKVSPRQGTASLANIKLSSGETVPGILSRQVGKGRVVYFAGLLEPQLYFNEVVGNQILSRPYQEQRDEQLEKLFLSLVKNTANEKITVSNLPQGVVLETYQHNFNGKSGMTVSLSNFTGMLTDGRPETQTQGYFEIKSKLPQPNKPIRITYRGEAKKAFAISPDFQGRKELALVRSNGAVSVELPTFGHLVMVYFE